MKQISQKRIEAIKLERKLYAILLKKCGGFCMTCGKLPDFADGRGKLHLSHKIPKSLGGKTDATNCILEDRQCHNLRHGIKEV